MTKRLSLEDQIKSAKIVVKPIGDLLPYVRNSRVHSETQLGRIASSIKEYGFTNPVLIDGNNGIIAGHARVQAAEKLGLKEVPCISLAHLTKSQKRAYIIADNRLAELSSWDSEVLKLEISDLKLEDYDLTLTGLDQDYISNALKDLSQEIDTENIDSVNRDQKNEEDEQEFGDVTDQRENDEDQATEETNDIIPEKVPDRAKSGERWQLGANTLQVGDCVEFMKTLPSDSIGAIVTDPPYLLTNSSGSGFMGKAWDSLSPKNAVAEAYFKSMKLDLSTGVGSTAAENANTNQLKTKDQRSSAPSAGKSSTDQHLSESQSTRSAHASVITKAEALALCAEWFPSHIKAVENLPEHARFVEPRFNTGTPTRNIVRTVVGILLDEPRWLGNVIISTKQVLPKSRATEDLSGLGSDAQFIKGTDGPADAVVNDARQNKSNATTSPLTLYQKTIQKITSSPFVSDAIKKCMEDQSFIPNLSEVFHYHWSKEAFRVLKPGGYMLAFNGPRTVHRMASAFEISGFEIRDQLAWMYGQGFPKSLNIAKAGAGEAWEGWGSALKPAYEPVVMARKPLDGTIAANVLKHGTGGLNIDASRIGMKEGDTSSSLRPCRIRQDETDHKDAIFGSENDSYKNDTKGAAIGRFPANLVLDEDAAKALDEQSGDRLSRPYTHRSTDNAVYGKSNEQKGIQGYSDSGGASRFFYVAKASRADKGEGNTHPTPKSQSLMRYLIRMVTPPGETVLDPFLGSGSTLIACELLGNPCLGSEKQTEYADIIIARYEKASNVLAELIT